MSAAPDSTARPPVEDRQFTFHASPNLAKQVSFDNVADAWGFYLDLLRECGDIQEFSAFDDTAENATNAAEFLLMVLAEAYVVCKYTDPNYPQFAPLTNHYFNVGAPCPDFTYYSATISGRASYRLFGNVNTAYGIDIQTAENWLGFGDKPGATFGSKRLHEYDIDDDGNFEILLSGHRPTSHGGNWLELDPRANFLLLRIIALRPDELNPRFGIERLDVDGPLRPPTPAEVDEKVRMTLRWMQINARAWAALPKRMLDKGYINEIHQVKYGTGEVVGQAYYQGLWDLEDDEALLIEWEIPECFYWNIQLNDRFWRTIDFVNRQSAINGRAGDRVDGDGTTRIVVSTHDPGVENWCDTTGLRRGDIVMRWMDGIGDPPVVKTAKLKLDELDSRLPADTRRVTPDQRRAALRARLEGYQLRRHGW